MTNTSGEGWGFQKSGLLPDREAEARRPAGMGSSKSQLLFLDLGNKLISGESTSRLFTGQGGSHTLHEARQALFHAARHVGSSLRVTECHPLTLSPPQKGAHRKLYQ